VTDADESRHAFPVVASSDVYIGRIIGLRVDDVVMPHGSVARREIVEYWGAVVVVAVDEAGNIVLLHQYRQPFRRRLWELPAGLLDVPGEDPLVAAQRELAEEAGLAAREWSTLLDVASASGFSDATARIFFARGLSPVARELGKDDEELDLVIRRVPLPEAVRMVFAGDILDATFATAVLAAHAVLTGVSSLRPADTPWPDRPTDRPQEPPLSRPATALRSRPLPPRAGETRERRAGDRLRHR